MKLLYLTPLVGISLLGVSLSPVQALESFNLKGDYDFVDTLTLFPEQDYLIGAAQGSSQNATLGLNQIEFLGYARLSEVFPALTNSTSYTFNSDPKFYGIDAQPGKFIFSGQEENKLFGTFVGLDQVNAQASTAFTTAQLTIVGGEGKFKNASGIGTLFGTINVNTSTLINTGKYSVDVNFTVPKSIPNSTNISGLLVVALTSFFVKKKVRSAA